MAKVSNIQPKFDWFIDTLNQYRETIENEYKEKLTEEGRKATGTLINSISTTIKQGASEYTVTMYVADYFKYIEEGRKAGKFPPQEAILKWIRVKPILPRPDNNGKLPTEKQLAFLISRAIAQNGTIKNKGYQGDKSLEKTTQEVNAHFIPLLKEALQRDFDEYSIKVWNGINKMIKI